MFTGIIEEVGKIAEIIDTGEFRTLRVEARTVMSDLVIGSSIAVNGVCLTARTVTQTHFSAELSRETLNRTSLGNLGRVACQSRASDASRFALRRPHCARTC